MTQSELAELLDISRQAVSQLLGEKSPKKEYIRKMIKIILKIKKAAAEKMLIENDTLEAVEMLTEKEVSTMTNYSINTLRQYRCSGKGPPFHVGEGKKGRITYPKNDVEKWLAGQKRRPKGKRVEHDVHSPES